MSVYSSNILVLFFATEKLKGTINEKLIIPSNGKREWNSPTWNGSDIYM